MLHAYRAAGADPPFGDPRGYHGTGMEGHFWRLTHAAAGTVVVAILAISRDRDDRPWSMVSLAVHPGGHVLSATLADAAAARRGLRLRAGDALRADERTLTVRVDGAALDVAFEEPVGWPRRAFGALGPAHAIPGLSQYWHPWLLDARVRGTLRLGGRELALDGARAYAEKNWGAGGMPPVWWWGQAHGFAREDVCVAFAGGRAGLGRLHVPAGALVARVGDRVVTAVRPPRPVRIDVGASGWRLRGGGIEIEGEAAGAEPHLLPVPVPLERRRIDGRAAQLLAGTVRLRVARRGGVTFAGESRLAGLELGRGHQATPREL
ncbi:MAG: tocopherol cyclase family protein [Solirubrobacteraceae bacterium]